jgi:cellobiose-specific phosphotransferase system component IIA
MAIKIWRVSLPGAGDEYFDHMFSIVTTEESASYAVPEVDGEPLYYFTQERIDNVVAGMQKEDAALPATNLEWAQIAALGLDRFHVRALEDAKNDDYATVEQAIAQEADTALEAYERRNRGVVEESEEEVITAAGEEACPPATQDIPINLANREKAIQDAAYGPLNPEEPNDEFWAEKAKRWSVEPEEAKKSLCGNCVMFITTSKMKDCIAQGIEQGGSGEGNAWDAIDAAELGYCEAFDFKCASSRTCNAWVTGGPITDEKAGE